MNFMLETFIIIALIESMLVMGAILCCAIKYLTE